MDRSVGNHTENPISSLQSFIDQIPFAKQMDIKLLQVKRGFVQLKIEPRPILFNHLGTYQAGIYFTLAEITGGVLFGTFIDLSRNFLITRKVEINFVSSTKGTLIAEASLGFPSIEALLTKLETKRKLTASVEVTLKTLEQQVLARSHNEYYLRLGMPKSFASVHQAS